MSYPKKLLRLRPTRGLGLDLPANEVSPDFYTGGSEIIFRDGIAERLGGERQAYSQSVTDPVFALLNVRAPGGVTESNFWLTFGEDDIQALETSNVDAVTGAALTAVTSPWQWSLTLLNNLPICTNGLDAPRYWGGDVGTPFTALPGWPAGTICKAIAAFRFHIFAFDIDGPSGHFESQVAWSDAADPGAVPSTWTAAATNEAGDAILADTPGPIMCGAPLAGSLVIFKRSSTYAADYVGGERIFNFRLLDGDRGALTRHSVIDVGGVFFVVGDGDIWLTDGTTWRSIAFGRVRDYLFGQLEQASYENLFVVHHRAKNEVWVCYPTAGNTFATEALIYNVAADAWGVRALTAVTCGAVGIVNDLAADESWNADAEAWDADLSAWNAANFSLATEQMLLGANAADLTLIDSGDATARDATLYRHDLTMGEPERLKFVRRLHCRTNATPGTLYVRVGSRMSVTDSTTWGAEVPLVPPASFVNVRALGRFISAEVRSEDTEVWQVSGFDLEYELRGYR